MDYVYVKHIILELTVLQVKLKIPKNKLKMQFL
jgi:hypothetical protein